MPHYFKNRQYLVYVDLDRMGIKGMTTLELWRVWRTWRTWCRRSLLSLIMLATVWIAEFLLLDGVVIR